MRDQVKFEKVWRATLETHNSTKMTPAELKRLKEQKMRDKHEML
jgi:hypothetical protein